MSDHRVFVESFVAAARVSSSETCARFEALLAELEDASRQVAAVAKLRALLVWSDANLDQRRAVHFSFTRLRISLFADQTRELVLLQLPSVFAPEEWSYTFYEGLTRLESSYFHRVNMAELGCGNGWISMALALRCAPTRVVGLDINPRAILSARVGLYLNAFDANCDTILDGDGLSLLERCEFHTSDLLAHCLDTHTSLDRVIGCIPQVLNPDLQRSVDALSEQATDEFLYSLSNYCGKQGYVEDQFGLGLMARGLEEAIAVLRPGGSFVFNMGGRPGQAVLRRLFERRGFGQRQIWQSRTVQAEDTDILTLVEIEQRSQHRFEFYMGMHADQPVSARTALAFAKTGGEICHAITVNQGSLAHPTEVKRIFSLLGQDAFREVVGALDLAFEDPQVAEEKTSFLASLADGISEPVCFPYQDAAGSEGFRQRLAHYLRAYCFVPLGPRSLVTAPTLSHALLNLVLLYRPRLILCDRELLARLPPSWVEDVSALGTEVLEGPERAHLTGRLIQALKPDMVFTALAEFENQTPESFARLLETTRATGSRLVVDISRDFDLSSQPKTQGVLQYLAEQALPAHAAVVCALVGGRVYSDLEMCFVLSEDEKLLKHLKFAAELTYSRTPSLAQDYYERILADLLSFRMHPEAVRVGESHRAASTAVEDQQASFIGLHEDCRRAFEHPALVSHRLPIGEDTIRLDYGENALPTPTSMRVRLFEAFARQNLSAEEIDPRPELSALLRRRFSVVAAEESHIVLGSGVSHLFASLVLACAAEKATLLLPRGGYGFFAAVAEFFSVPVVWIESSSQTGYKPTRASLCTALRACERPWVYINAPIVNPTGAIYSGAEIGELLTAARDAGAPVVLDTVFAGLEFPGQEDAWDLSAFLQTRAGEGAALELVVLGGISKEFAAGGLRFGYAYANSARLRAALRRGAHHAPPHHTLSHALKRLLQDLSSPSEATRAELFGQRSTLQQRAERLREVLDRCGWETLPPRGGLFLVACPTAYMGRAFEWVNATTGQTQRWTLDGENLWQALFHSTGLLINNDVWTGLAGYSRFVLSVEERDFEAALRALEKFEALVMK